MSNFRSLIKLNLCLLILVSLLGVSFTKSETVVAGVDIESALNTSINEVNIDPEKLYLRVWDLIKKDFVDQNFNSQDWNIWRDRYKGKLHTLEDSHKAIETMLASLGDRYTRFLTKKDFDDEKQAINAKLTGVGIQIGLDKTHKLVIIAPIEGTPGFRAGLRAGDEIVEIDGNPTKGISVEEAANQIKGPIGTPVVLTIQREAEKKAFEKKIVRAEIPIRSISKGDAKIINKNIGYIRLNSFISQEASREMKSAIEKLDKAQGLIIDLRNNPGGLLTNAIEISDMFLESGIIVSTVDRDGYVQSVTADDKTITKKPVVILVNENSASASEIFSGALKDNDRARIVGARTFGKGLIQGINRLEDGSGVNVTIAKYLTPSKTDINELGIRPHAEVKLTIDDYKASKGPWFSDPNELPSKRKPEDGKDLQLNEGVKVIQSLIKVNNNIEKASKS